MQLPAIQKSFMLPLLCAAVHIKSSVELRENGIFFSHLVLCVTAK